METFITLQNLSTISTLVLIVILFVQNTKEIVDNVCNKLFHKSIPTKYLTFTISQILLFMSKYYLGTDFSNSEEIFVNFINGCILAGLSSKSVETLIGKNKGIGNGIDKDFRVKDDIVDG